MTREKIISLARELWVVPRYAELDEHQMQCVETFYHAAQAEAFEAAAVKCHEVKNNSRHHLFRSAAKICAAAIREMAKEMK